MVNALLDLSSVKDVRFSISKVFWQGFPFYSTLAPRVFGTITKWVNKGQLRVSVIWDDGEVEPLGLTELLPACMRLEAYRDNRRAPQPKRRRNEAREDEGTASGDSANAQNLPLGDVVASLKFRRGGRECTADWWETTADGITIDERRQQERWRPRINREKAEFKTPYLLWQNVALPWEFMRKMFDVDGFINQRLSGKNMSAYHRKTSLGEGIRFLGYMYAIALNPGTPVRAMWQEKERPGEEKSILPPPALGRFGMSKDRFERLEQLAGLMFSVSESELDESDPWRYCSLALAQHNAHWLSVYHASWLLAIDESMSPFVPEREGDGPLDIPFLSNVPRKPSPLGAEIKTVADGESGAIIYLELALRFKRKRNGTQVVPTFAEQPGKDTMEAQCLRLTEPWHFTERAVGADAHFISYASCEAMREKVCPPALQLAPCPCLCIC